MQLKKATYLFLSVFGFTVSTFGQTTVDGVVAIVGSDIILKSEVDEQYDMMRRQNFGEELSECAVFEELFFQNVFERRYILRPTPLYVQGLD